MGRFEKKMEHLQDLEKQIDELVESECGDSGDFAKKIAKWAKWAKLSHRIEDWSWGKGHGKDKGHHKAWLEKAKDIMGKAKSSKEAWLAKAKGKGGPFFWNADVVDWCKDDATSWYQGAHESHADWDWSMWSQECGKGWPCGKGWWNFGPPGSRGSGW